MSKFTIITVLMIFCGTFTLGLAAVSQDKGLSGTVVYADYSPAAGTVVYAIDKRHPLRINNNIIMVAENIPRAITDVNGNFCLKNVTDSDVLLFARDMQDGSVFAAPQINVAGEIEITIQSPAMIKGVLLKGDDPVKGQKVTAYYKTPEQALRYTHTSTTNSKGEFKFRDVMAGEYLVQVISEVPQVGCCFKSVVTRQAKVVADAGSKKEIKLGGTDLPFLTGRITDSQGNGLHGVWVRLEQIAQDDSHIEQDYNKGVAWSEVTEKDGTYHIYDIPPGDYKLHCFRRLALNNSGRTLRAEQTVTVKKNLGTALTTASRVENICDVAIDLEPFMPLEYGQAAPDLKGTLLTGEKFDLAEQKGKIVVLHFYASWCLPCVASMGEFDVLADAFDADKLIVIGISLDETLDDCAGFISEKAVQHAQLFAGPWTSSQTRKDFRVVNVPTSFIIDADGKVAQIDLFGNVLKEFVKNLLDQR